MKKETVKRSIFISNALMVLVILLIFLAINLLVVKVYSETIEQEIQASVEQMVGEEGLKDFIMDWTVQRNEFLLLFALDGIVCAIVLVLISQMFTRHLTRRIMEPLEALSEGAERIRENDLTKDVMYVGDLEFEQVCRTFNEMQRHILAEQEKNRKYEKARTEMIAGISHDLRTPLTAVRGTIKGLLDGIVTTPELQGKFLQAAYRRTGDMELLLNQLFDLSKVETGNLPLSLCDLELSEFLQSYVTGKQGLLEADEAMTLDANGVQAQVQIDPEQFQRILDNLFENSRKYAERKPLLVKLWMERSPLGVRICFCDNWVGVPDEKLPHIFEEFYRADESRGRKEGNGLGLYIVQSLVQAMQGRIWAENEDGLAVWIELPVAGKGGWQDGE